MAKKEKDPAKLAAEAQEKAQRQTRSNFVETLAGYGMDPAEIGLLMVPAMSGEAVKAEFAGELETGPAKANLEAVMTLRAGVKKGNITACIYWTKARMGWTEKGPGDKENKPPSESGKPVPAEGMEALASALNSKTIIPFRGKS